MNEYPKQHNKERKKTHKWIEIHNRLLPSDHSFNKSQTAWWYCFYFLNEKSDSTCWEHQEEVLPSFNRLHLISHLLCQGKTRFRKPDEKYGGLFSSVNITEKKAFQLHAASVCNKSNHSLLRQQMQINERLIGQINQSVKDLRFRDQLQAYQKMKRTKKNSRYSISVALSAHLLTQAQHNKALSTISNNISGAKM